MTLVPNATPTKPDWAYRWENSAVYISADGGRTWRLFMYFPKR
jgi:hypothetical protein